MEDAAVAVLPGVAADPVAAAVCVELAGGLGCGVADDPTEQSTPWLPDPRRIDRIQGQIGAENQLRVLCRCLLPLIFHASCLGSLKHRFASKFQHSKHITM